VAAISEWLPQRGDGVVVNGRQDDLKLTRRYYETNAERYAAATIAAPMHPLVGTFAGKLSPGALVLDLGCGSGRDLQSLSTLHHKYTNV
jgi:SAM-dependent methyltransferase